jgi:hypothetical protein
MGIWEDATLEQAELCHIAKCSDLADCEKIVFNPDEATK